MPFWKPGAKQPGSDSSLDRKVVGEARTFKHNRFSHYSMKEQRERLPIYNYRKAILYLMENNRVLIIVGETGSGKTTQLPQYLFETGYPKTIVCTQPRRISCVNVAKRVSVERNCELGSTVGYSIQFDPCYVPNQTKIKYVTDGMLIREMMMDPLLTEYSVVMVDEAHERSIHTDLVVGLLKKIMKRRDDLKLVISSATLEAMDFKKFFYPFPSSILSVEGRQYPVDIFYLTRPSSDYIKGTVETVMKIHQENPGGSGDILCFVTGQDEVYETISLIEDAMEKHPNLRTDSLVPLPLFAHLPLKEQMRVFDPLPYSSRQRKCIISTNVAESSVTIDGIRYIVDPGFSKQRYYDPSSLSSHKESLVITPISKASARQRAGRAGRIGVGGQCYRLMTQKDYQEKLPKHTVPEIQRSNLVPVVLQLKALGIKDVLHFNYLSPPPAKNLSRALETLYLLGAIDGNCKLVRPMGYQMSDFPVTPRLACVLIRSGEFGCVEEMLTIVAFLTVSHVFTLVKKDQLRVEKAKKKFACMEGDMIAYLNVYEGFVAQRPNHRSKWCKEHFIDIKCMKRMLNVRKQLKTYLRKAKVRWRRNQGTNQPSMVKVIQKCFCYGYFENVVQRRPEGYFVPVVGRGSGAEEERYFIHPTSTLFKYPPEWMIYFELLETSKVYMRDVMKIDPVFLTEICPQYFKFTRVGGSSEKENTILDQNMF